MFVGLHPHALRRWVARGALLCAPLASALAQGECPGVANPLVDSAWTSYRANAIDAARTLFGRALQQCPAHIGALVGHGYVLLRDNDVNGAVARFRTALATNDSLTDAWIGLGLARWRAGDLEESRVAFERVRALDAGNADARDYLARIAAARGNRPPPRPDRPAFQRPTTTQYNSRVSGDHFEIRTANGWAPFYVKGMNIGAALPGKYPSEFPDSATYARWLVQIGAMGANTIRVYTVHPPGFYAALRAYNLSRATPLWIIHGVWAELPPEDIRYDDRAWEADFFREIRSVIDLLHGRADIAERPGHAGGHYTADVSQWVFAYILGREWESHSVAGWNVLRPQLRSFRGTYLTLANGTPMDAWMAKAAEHAIAHEMDTYNAQRPIAYTNWPTTDPLAHPSEASTSEELGIRRAKGEVAAYRESLDGEDAVTLDPNLVHATESFPAGWFASYHVYPYFPDFMVMSREYNRARSPYGPSNYWGYIDALKKHHIGIPLLISEYGVPSSIGVAHVHPQGWHHGGNTEAAMADINVRLTREIAASGSAGGIIFEWIDEWFKKTWNTSPFEVPLDRNRNWHNRLDAEEHYGLLAMEAASPADATSVAARASAWRARTPLYASDSVTVRAMTDASYLRLRVELGTNAVEDLYIGLDLDTPALGGLAWPRRVGRGPAAGAEFVVHVTRDTVRLLAHPASNPIRVVEGDRRIRGAPVRDYPPVGNPPPGFFRGRYNYFFQLPLVGAATSDGIYEPLRTLTSRSRWMRDSTEVGAMGYEWGVLPAGPLPDGLWERDAATGTVDVRIPWQLINVSDPSSLRVLHEARPRIADLEELGTRAIGGIGVTLAWHPRGSGWRELPASGSRSDVARITWRSWEEPAYVERLKPSYDAMREAWRTLDPVVLKGAGR